MQTYFMTLTQSLNEQLLEDERLLINYQGEVSDFIRLNHSKIRQAGQITQHYLTLELVQIRSHVSTQLTLCGNAAMDLELATIALEGLRNELMHVPEDPYLNLPKAVTRSDYKEDNTLPEADAAVAQILQMSTGMDLVGYWASGTMANGMSDSMGSFHWHSSNSFNFDWSCYSNESDETPQAVKNSYAGKQWQQATLAEKLDKDRQALNILQREPVVLEPGDYRAYLEPAAVAEIIGMLGWGDFGLKSQRTRSSALLQLLEDEQQFDPKVTLTEAHGQGINPTFTQQGFLIDKPVTLVKQGQHHQALVGSRSAAEFSQPVSCDSESPQTLTMQPGTLASSDILKALDTGVYISNLWYCNYSDRNHARITGMTRFASFWVEQGIIVGPLSVIRFDDTLYRMLGENLLELGAECETSISPSSYHQRSSSSMTLPGALLRKLRLTL